jgi:hypothetical protein
MCLSLLAGGDRTQTWKIPPVTFTSQRNVAIEVTSPLGSASSALTREGGEQDDVNPYLPLEGGAARKRRKESDSGRSPAKRASPFPWEGGRGHCPGNCVACLDTNMRAIADSGSRSEREGMG